MRQEERGTFQMLWDCSNCGTTGLLGVSHRHCPACGSAQDPAARYFPSDDQKVALENHTYTGADWKCGACDTPNSSQATFCINCGSGKDGSKEVKRREAQATAAGSAFEEDTAKAARAELASRPAAPPETQAKISGMGAWIVGGIVLVLVAIVLAMTWKREANVVVTGHVWTRSIGIEMYGPDRQDAWRDQVPPRAYDLSCRKEVRSTRQIPDGETCRDKRVDRGDGSFKEVRECVPKFRDEPVYDQKCSYFIDTWKESRRETASGSSLKEKPVWPEIRLAREGSCVGCEREGSREQTYTVRFQASDAPEKTYECGLAEEQWSALTEGKRVKSKAGVLTGKLDCGALQVLP